MAMILCPATGVIIKGDWGGGTVVNGKLMTSEIHWIASVGIGVFTSSRGLGKAKFVFNFLFLNV